MVDLDLTILGQDPASYDRFERDVRTEYGWVPEEIFRARRAAILREFAGRPAIFHHASVRERYEQSARRNLARAIEALS